MILQNTTELEAVNTMLSNLGEAPVNTLEDGDVVDAGVARTILKSMSREVQTRGWWFNTDLQREFLPTAAKRIQLPSNTLRVDVSGTDRFEKDYVQRGPYMYDRKNHTFDIEEKVKLDLVVGLDFTDLPESARRYVTLRAARVFQERMLGAPSISGFNQQDEAMARAQLLSEDNEATDFNMLSDSASVANVLSRSYFTLR